MEQTPEQRADAAAATLTGLSRAEYDELVRLATEVRPWARTSDATPDSEEGLARFEDLFNPFVERNRLHPGDGRWDKFDWRMHLKRQVEQAVSL